MTRALTGAELAQGMPAALTGSVTEIAPGWVSVRPERIRDVCLHLRDSDGPGFDYLLSLTAVDYVDYFEVVYHLLSLSANQGAVVKTRLWGRAGLRLPSVTPVWKSADFQEREVYDLLGIEFEGHPNLKRIMMWEGFPGHPLRKDFLEFDHRTFLQ